MNTPSRRILSLRLFPPFARASADAFPARTRSAVNAGSSSWTDSSSGVRLGRKFRVGKMASSKTLERPVFWSVWSGSLVRKSVARMRPRDRTLVAGSSRRVSRTGMKRGQLRLIRSPCYCVSNT